MCYGNDGCSSCYDYLCVEMTAMIIILCRNDSYSSCYDYLCSDDSYSSCYDYLCSDDSYSSCYDYLCVEMTAMIICVLK